MINDNKISELVENSGYSLEKILQGFTQLIPPSLQYPNITCSKVILEDKEYKTKNYLDTDWNISLDIKVFEKKAGLLKVCCLSKQSFSQEERILLDSVTERLGKIIERIKTKQKLIESEKEKSLILNNTVDKIVFLNLKHEIVWANKNYISITGKTKLEEIKGKKCSHISNMGKICNGCPVIKTIKTGEPFTAELSSENQSNWPSNMGCWLSRSTPVKDIDGNLIGVLEVSTDITKLKNTQKDALILKAAIEQAPIGVALADKNLNLYYCNPAGLGIRGGNKGELVKIPKDAFDNWQVLRLNGEPYEVDNLPLVRTVVEGKVIREDFIVRSQNQTDCICEAIACPVYDNKKVVAGIVFFPDITKRKRIENQLQLSNIRIKHTHKHAIYMLAVASEYRDSDTGNHIKRIGRMTKNIAKELGINAARCKTMESDSLLHDIGKIGIPDTILLKQGKLTNSEFELMKEHTVKGAKIIGNDKGFKQAKEIALYHHEKWDGKGYPKGLKGEKIPLSARIVAVADVFDALISERPYKKAWTKHKAINNIKYGAGNSFDPKVVEAFLRVVKKK